MGRLWWATDQKWHSESQGVQWGWAWYYGYLEVRTEHRVKAIRMNQGKEKTRSWLVLSTWLLSPSKMFQLAGLVGSERHLSIFRGSRNFLTKTKNFYSTDKRFNMQNYGTIVVNDCQDVSNLIPVLVWIERGSIR